MVSRVVLVRRVLKDPPTMDMPVFVSPAILVLRYGTMLLPVKSVRAQRQVLSRTIVVITLVVIQQQLETALIVPAKMVSLVVVLLTNARYVWKERAMVLTVALAHFVARVLLGMGTNAFVTQHTFPT
jgi:hypothetical protein